MIAAMRYFFKVITIAAFVIGSGVATSAFSGLETSAFAASKKSGKFKSGHVRYKQYGYKRGVKARNFHRANRAHRNLHSGVRRSGVYLSGSRSYSGARGYIARRNQINRRNERVVLENALRREQRSGAVLANRGTSRGFFVDAPRQGILTADNGGVVGNVVTNVNPCPARHNCGYRIYENGAGPRIIRPSIPAGNGLPPYDGVSGPVIYTPYD
ncbi:MAG: hypothetical protein AAF217_04505 [Pseudomonadota bacterium]